MNYPLKTAAFWGLQSSLHCAATIPLHSFLKSPEPTPSSPPQRSLSCAPTMALRTAMLKSAGEKMMSVYGEKMMSVYGPIRWAHTIAAQPPPLDVSMSPVAVTGPFVLPEYDRDSEYSNGNVGFEFPFFTFGGGSIELMAVPKRKVSPHKRGIRNGPKALKPVPVIVRCKSCGRVKLPHFYCCSGDRGNTGEPNSSSN